MLLAALVFEIQSIATSMLTNNELVPSTLNSQSEELKTDGNIHHKHWSNMTIYYGILCCPIKLILKNVIEFFFTIKLYKCHSKGMRDLHLHTLMLLKPIRRCGFQECISGDVTIIHYS